jgi:broad specificity phosphatase PhoE
MGCGCWEFQRQSECKMIKLNNKYYLLRHGEAISNVNGVVSSWPEKFHNPLTQNGINQIKSAIKKLKYKRIDMIFASDLLRTKQTAQMVARALKINLKFDKRLREIGFGIFNAKPVDYQDVNFKIEEKWRLKHKAETYKSVSNRILSFLREIDKDHKDKKILIVSHQAPLWFLEAKISKISLLQIFKKRPVNQRIEKGEIRELN